MTMSARKEKEKETETRLDTSLSDFDFEGVPASIMECETTPKAQQPQQRQSCSGGAAALVDVNSEGNPQLMGQETTTTVTTNSCPSGVSTNDDTSADPLIALMSETLTQKMTQMGVGDEKMTTRSKRRRKRKGSPLKEQYDLAEGVFQTMTTVMGKYLDNFKAKLIDKLSSDYDRALQKQQDEIETLMKLHTEEVNILSTEVQSTKRPAVSYRGASDPCREANR